MNFNPHAYGPVVASILALDGNGERLMPLASGRCSSEEAFKKLQTSTAALLFPNSRAPEEALSGLYLYFSCLDQSHEISQSSHLVEGAFWHGIMHRQEPDAANARYWFRQVPSHPIFADLARAGAEIASRYPQAGVSLDGPWDAIRFAGFCERARQEPGSTVERIALEAQRAEWQLLFDYCASHGSRGL
jgi:hypothetical protein